MANKLLGGLAGVVLSLQATAEEVKSFNFVRNPHTIVFSPSEYQPSDSVDPKTMDYTAARRAIKNPKDAQAFALAHVTNNVYEGHHNSAKTTYDTQTGVCKSIAHLIADLVSDDKYVSNLLLMADLEHGSGPDHVVVIYRYNVDDKNVFAAYGVDAPIGHFQTPDQIVTKINEATGATYTHLGIYGLRTNFEYTWRVSPDPISERKINLRDLQPLKTE